MIRTCSTLIALSALSAMAGCTSGTAGEVKLGVDVAAMRSAAVDSAAADLRTEAGLEVTRVRLLVEEAKIGYLGDEPGEESAEAGPFVIELSADEIANGAHREFSLGSLPAGTYGGAEIEIEPLADGSDASDEALADFLAEGASLLVDGTYQGTAFQLAGHFLAEQGTDGEVTIEEGSPVSLQLEIDPAGWFLDAAGAVIDPTDTAAHPALAVAICETLDTQEQAGGGAGGADADCPDMDGAGGASADGELADAPDGAAAPVKDGPEGAKKGGKKGGGKGGGHAHCVEPATTG